MCIRDSSKTFDNGMICASEQSVTAIADIYDAVKAEFIKRGCYVLNNTELDAVRKILLTEAGTVNAKIVGQPAPAVSYTHLDVYKRQLVMCYYYTNISSFVQ